MPDPTYAQGNCIEQLDIATADMVGAIRRALILNGLRPDSKEAKGIVGELAKVRNAAVQEMMKDRTPPKKMRDYA